MTTQPFLHDEISRPLTALGWDAAWERDFTALSRPDLVPGRVVRQHRSRWVVATPGGETAATPAGRLLHEGADLPVVGDWVALAPPAGEGAARIHALLPRRGAFRRKTPGEGAAPQVLAANLDLALIVAALAEEPNARRLERYLALAWESGALPAVLLTKADLHPDPEAAAARLRSRLPGTEVRVLSSRTGEGVEPLSRLLLPGRTAVLLGPSGVGKSTLVNLLNGEERLRTGEVRSDGKGRHTTTHRHLVRLPGGALLIDTPGLREVALWDADAGVEAAFEELTALAEGCRFRDCSHRGEPGCAVSLAVAEGRLDADRLESWQRLRAELEYLDRRDDHAASARERAHAKSMERSLRSHLRKKYGR